MQFASLMSSWFSWLHISKWKNIWKEIIELWDRLTTKTKSRWLWDDLKMTSRRFRSLRIIIVPRICRFDTSLVYVGFKVHKWFEYRIETLIWLWLKSYDARLEQAVLQSQNHSHLYRTRFLSKSHTVWETGQQDDLG